MKTFTFVSVILFSLISSYSDAQTDYKESSEFKRRMDSLLKNQNVPTLAIGLIQNNEIVMTEVFGLSTPTNNAPSELHFSVKGIPSKRPLHQMQLPV